MVIITAYELKSKSENQLPVVVCKEKTYCPCCGTKLQFKDHVKRHRKLAGGDKQWFLIERHNCPNECGLHRIIPDFMVPYKHYDNDIITGVLNGSIKSACLTFEDYPCEKTMQRWKAWIQKNFTFINEYLRSVGMRLFAIGIIMAYEAANIVEELKKRERRLWLRITIRAVYNTGASLEPYRDHSG